MLKYDFRFMIYGQLLGNNRHPHTIFFKGITSNSCYENQKWAFGQNVFPVGILTCGGVWRFMVQTNGHNNTCVYLNVLYTR